MKKVRKYLSFFILTCLCICIASCGKDTQTEKHPTNYEQLSQLIGKNQEDVCEALELKEDDMQLVVVGLYKIPEKTDFLDASYDVLLNFDVESGEMYSFCYQQTYTNEENSAKERVEYLLQQLIELHGEPDTYKSVSNRINNQKELENKFKMKQVFTAYETWEISDSMDLYLNVSSNGETNVTIQLQYKRK